MTNPDAVFHPPLRDPVTAPHSTPPDVFDDPSVTRNEARLARAGFEAAELIPKSFGFRRGQFHAVVTLGQHRQEITHPTITGLATQAARLRAEFDTTQEAA